MGYVGSRALGFVIAAICLFSACADDDAVRFDASAAVDMSSSDNTLAVDATVPSVLDFVVDGCQTRTESTCSGAVPLTLTFVAVGGNANEVMSWDFGDGSLPQTGETIRHEFDQVGEYTITLNVGSYEGTSSETKYAFVVVKGGTVGARCFQDSDCAQGVCVCNNDDCSEPITNGLCMLTCETECADDAECVDLSSSENENESGAEPWRDKICLQGCDVDDDCSRPGFFCGVARAASEGWVKACVPVTLGEIGANCEIDGEPDSNRCLGGICLALGAAGYCSAQCGLENQCPYGAACVQFESESNIGEISVCMADCDYFACDADPLLACEQADSSGDFGFAVESGSEVSAAGLCAPKRCLGEAGECGQGGGCDQSIGGFCRVEDAEK